MSTEQVLFYLESGSRNAFLGILHLDNLIFLCDD